ncbi:MAG: SAM-dependent methyltransferase [Candidatus Dadabacteria bacterium CSP1-2]|nr:MAG: SAM-dependent methyltransferase [Candidatus Dadabacteria bacterium CSP1-2]MBF8302196.1 SAM-dependent methyltransferase [Candidatus Dadabacteria bacterium]
MNNIHASCILHRVSFISANSCLLLVKLMSLEFKIKEDETLDGPDGLKILQKKKGYRYSQDSLQLVDFASVRKNDEVIDLGTGCGVMALILAKRGFGRRIVGLEVQEELADLARRSVNLNGFQEKIEIVEGDIRTVKSLFPPSSFDYVITNPPYIEAKSGLISPGSERALARHEILCDMNDILEAIKYLLKPSKRGSCVYPASRFDELIIKAKKKRLEPKRARFVHPGPEEKAELAMVEFIKEGKSGLKVLPPLL